MKKLFIIYIICLSINAFAQGGKGAKIGYVDMEYILKSIPEYQEAKTQLENKANEWKSNIELKKNAISKLKEDLNKEKVLLTKELIEEREEEIAIEEASLLDYQNKKFGTNGDLITQKITLVKPVQDQVFTAVQDYAETRGYDFVIDLSSDKSFLFAGSRFNISEQIIRNITRSTKKEQLTKKQLKEREEKDNQDDNEKEDPSLAERRKKLDERKAAREQAIKDKQEAAALKKKERDDARAKKMEENKNKKNGTVSVNENKEGQTKVVNQTDNKEEIDKSKKEIELKKETAASLKELNKKINDEKKEDLKTKQDQVKASREQQRLDRLKAIDDKKLKIQKTKDSIKKVKEEKLKNKN
jgi:Skp family chaperone for outer membrane proteins